MAKRSANSGNPDQMPLSAASDLHLHCLPVTLLQVSRLQWVYNKPYEFSVQEVVGSTPAGLATFFRGIDHEIFSWSFTLPLIQEGQLSVSGKRMCTSTG